jgi:polyprenyl-phospho-N-acetylgalactosaminyl synthase
MLTLREIALVLLYKHMSNGDVAIIMPVYNEAQVVAHTINTVLKKFPFVVCVDDGSVDASASEVGKTPAVLVQHPINLGQGAAIQTGIEYALKDPKVQYFVTFDSDGQHDVADVERMLRILKEKKLDVVLGSRFLGKTLGMGLVKRLTLKAAIGFTNLDSKLQLTDAHNGLRVFTRAFAQKLNIQEPGMAHASEIVNKIGAGNWRYAEAPVTIRYTDYSQAKGQPILNSVNILFDLLLSKSSR